MDVLNVDNNVSDEEGDEGIQHLVQGLNMSDLSSTGTEFGVQVNEDIALEKQSYIGYPNLFQHLNLRCLGPEDDGINTEPEYDADTPFSSIARSMTDLLPNGKIKKRIMKEGYGEVVPEDALVWFHHNSYQETQDEPFDSSYLRGPMTMLRLNSGKCLPGLDIGLSTMKRDEMAEFLIHPDYAYGKMGSPPRIDPDAHILIRVELKKFVDNALAMKMGELTEEELKITPFDDIYKGALSLLMSGNNDFSLKRYPIASKLYRNALRILENCDMKTDEEDTKNEKLRLQLYTNLGVCYNKMNRPKQAIVQCQTAYRINPRNPKVLYQLGLAHLNLSSFDESKKFAFLAKKYAPRNADVSTLLQKIEKKMKRYNSCTVSFARNAFKFAENRTGNVSNTGDGSEKDTKAPVDGLDENEVKSSQTQTSGVKIIELTDETQKISEKTAGNEKPNNINLLLPETLPDSDQQTEFQKEVISYIQEFFDDPTRRQLALPIGLTFEEETFCRTQAKMYDLRVEEQEEDGRTQVFFIK